LLSCDKHAQVLVSKIQIFLMFNTPFSHAKWRQYKAALVVPEADIVGRIQGCQSGFGTARTVTESTANSIPAVCVANALYHPWRKRMR
jgi:hypothetical protein